METLAEYCRDRFAPLAAALVVLAFALGLVGGAGDYFYDIDEAKYVQASREMLATGDYLRPMFNGLPRIEKPPLVYWLTAPALAVFGDSPASARIPAALAGALMCLACVLIGRAAFSEATGLAAGLMLACSVAFHFLTSFIKVDIFFACLFTYTAYFLLRRLAGDTRARTLAWATLAMALGFLAKGPFALMPLAAYAAALALVHGPARAVGHWKGVLVSAVSAALPFALWLALAQMDGVDYVGGFAAQFTANSVMSKFEVVDQLKKVAFYLLYAPVAVFFPWGMYLPGAAWDYVRRFGRNRPANLFFACLVAVVLAADLFVFRLKAHRYFLPALPVLAVLAADWLLAAPRDRANRLLFWLGTILAASAVGVYAWRFHMAGGLPINLWDHFPVRRLTPPLYALGALAALFVPALFVLGRFQAKRPALHIAGLAIFFILGASAFRLAAPVHPSMAQARPTPLLGKSLAEVTAALPPDTLLAHSTHFQQAFPDFVYHATRPDGPRPCTLSAPFDAGRFLAALANPQKAPALFGHPAEPALPAHKALASRPWTRTALLVTGNELNQLRVMHDHLPPNIRRPLSVAAIRALSVKWVPTTVYLVQMQ